MSEENNKKSKKKQLLSIEILALVTLVVFGYFGYKYWQISKNKVAAEITKSDNHDIFDFATDYKNSAENYDLSDMTVNEVKEKGAEFIYQLLLKNQLQINDLKSEVLVLKEEFLKYKSREKIGKIIFGYIELRQDLFAGKPHEESLKNFEMLVFSNEFLQNKLAKIKPLLPNFLTPQDLQKNFNDSIPELIADKSRNIADDNFVNKARRYLTKLIVIRRIDGKVENDVDGIIVKIEKSLKEGNYQAALDFALTLDQKYHTSLAGFLEKLHVAIEVNKLDQDVLNHLKSLN